MAEQGRVLEVREKTIVVSVNGRKKEVVPTRKVSVGEVVSIFQNLVL